jgi:hypothetical protein
MSCQTGTATDYANLLDLLDAFLTSQGMTLEPSFAGAGNGTIAGLIGGSASVAEAMTITFTSATAFSVVGSVSGALANGVVGTAYADPHINFMITAGATSFVAGDAFTVSTTPPWTSLRRTAGTEMIWQAPGNGNLDQIFVGAETFSNVGADYYNWRLGGFTAFDSSLAFESQAGYIGGPGQTVPSPVLNLWDSSIPYWFIANGRRVIVIAKVSTIYVACYLGFMSTYMSPGSFPYPLVVGGSMAWGGGSITGEPAADDARWRWSYVGNELRDFPSPFPNALSFDSQSTLRLRLSTGEWKGFSGSTNDPTFGRVWPYGDANSNVGMANWTTNLDGGYTLFPIVLFDALPNVYGELEGIVATTGYQQSSENTITIGGTQYLVVQNVNRTTSIDYFAVKLT